jgi:hypothetical protein
MADTISNAPKILSITSIKLTGLGSMIFAELEFTPYIFWEAADSKGASVEI